MSSAFPDGGGARASSQLVQEPPAAEPVEADELESLAERFARLSREAEPHARVDQALRALDLVIAGLGIVLLLPLLLLVAATLLVTSGRPILYRGERVGLHGRIFTMLKFRTLATDAESRLAGHYGADLTRLTEAETTTAGRGLRVSQLDELPQLWCVLVGDMSLVGPRPIRPTFFSDLAREIPQYWQRLVVRPGLTGFAQMRMTREETWQQKLAHDLEYVADRSVGLYLRVVTATFWRVLRQSFAALWGMLRSLLGAGRRGQP
jgi:lipopolysaccharide/colanic/teichoic acid biosynthesis glycosyltransferase